MPNPLIPALNRALYVGYDFDTYVDDLRARLQVTFAAEFNDFALSSLGILLLDLMAYGLDTLSFFLDRRTSDNYLATARTRKAVARITRQLGYKMGPAVSSSGDLKISLASPLGFDVSMPKGFRFQGPNNLLFETARAVTFPANSVAFKLVPCYEGETLIEDFVSDGTAHQVLALRRVPEGKFVVLGSVKVTVNGAPFVENDFLTFEKTDQFEVGYNDDPPAVRFGDGVVGNIPTAQASISIEYIASSGKIGQVTKNTITAEVMPLVVNFQAISLVITNPDPVVGGDDPETIEHAKAFAGKVFKSQKSAVTREDYEALAGSYADPLFGRVAVAKALATRSASTDITLQNAVSGVKVEVAKPVPAVNTGATNATGYITGAQADLTDLGTALTNAAVKVTSADGHLDTARISARTVKNKAEEIVAAAQVVQDKVIDGKATIDAVSTGNPSQLTAQDKDNLKKFFDLIATQATSLSASASAVGTSSGTEAAEVGAAKDDLADVGLDLVTSGTLLYAAEQERTDADAKLGLIRTEVTAMKTAVVNVEAAVATWLDALSDHVDNILAADCQANLVTVPILARDAAGFYTAPSSSLVQSLQAFLDARKEVTQTVSVVSGDSFLRPVVLTIRVGVLPNHSQSVVKTAVEAFTDRLLRDRKFGAGLYFSDFDPLKRIAGLGFFNVTIAGHQESGITVTTRLDGSGNLVIPVSEVITKGSVTVTTEALLS